MDQNDLAKHSTKARTIRTPKVRPAKEAPATDAPEVQATEGTEAAPAPASTRKKAQRVFAAISPGERRTKVFKAINGALRLLRKFRPMDLAEFGSVADYTKLAIETLENAAAALPGKTPAAVHKAAKQAIGAGAAVQIKPGALKRYADILADQAGAAFRVVELRGKSALVEFANAAPSTLAGAKLFIRAADLTVVAAPVEG